MPTAHSKPGVALGAGTGSIGDPFNMQETLSPLNTNGIASGDNLAMMTDGATVEAITANMTLPITYVTVYPVDFAGALTTDPWIADGSALSVGDMLAMSARSVAFMPEMRNAPANGIGLPASADLSLVYGARVIDPVASGIVAANGCDSVKIASCYVTGAGGFGINMNDSSDPGDVVNCFIDNHNSAFAAVFTPGMVYNTIAVIDATGLTTLVGMRAQLAGSRSGFDHCTVVIVGDTSSLSAAADCFRIEGSSVTFIKNVTNCLAVCDVTDVANLHAFGYLSATVPTVLKNNRVFNISNVLRNSPAAVSGWFETPATLDPDLVDVAAGDFRPQTDMSTLSILSKIANEGVDWRDIGALSSKLGGGGGGVSSIFGSIR